MAEAMVEILLVEDDLNDEKLALHAFEKFNIRDSVHVVRDGAEALEYVFCTGAYSDRKIEDLKVILLDLKLPTVHGLEVLRQIRSDPRTKALPVVVLSSSNEERDLVESYKLEITSYIIKPVDFEHFDLFARHLGHMWLVLNHQSISEEGKLPAFSGLASTRS